MGEQQLAAEQERLGQRPALIVVNLINNVISPKGSEKASEVTLNANQRLIDAFRLSSLPVCFTTAGLTLTATDDSAISTADNAKRLVAVDDEPTFALLAASAFDDPSLQEWLEGQLVDSIVITGSTFDHTMLATITDGLSFDYPIWIGQDACIGPLPEEIANLTQCESVSNIIEHLTFGQELSDADII